MTIEPPFRLFLVDHEPTVVEALRAAFADDPGVTVIHGNILDVAEDTLVSPANSYGFMDGGIDAAYREFFGAALEAMVQEAAGSRPEGLLPIGTATVIHTGHPRIPRLIVAPTMVTPEPVPALNCLRAMAAVLRVASVHRGIERLFCPGLGTGVGMVPPREAAEHMHRAWAGWRGRLGGMRLERRESPPSEEETDG